MRKKDDSSDFEGGIVVGIKQAGLSISENKVFPLIIIITLNSGGTGMQLLLQMLYCKNIHKNSICLKGV